MLRCFLNVHEIIGNHRRRTLRRLPVGLKSSYTMKHTTFTRCLLPAACCLLICFPLSAQFMPKAQKQSGTVQINIPNAERRNFKLFATGTALSFVSGFSYGAREVVQHKPWRIPSTWNQQWWDSSKSWTNKYFQNNVDEGRNRTPVMFTDAYHLSGTIHRWTTTGAGICVGANSNNWKSWKHLALNVLWNCLAFQAGFTITYRSGAIFPR
jgi:hypothetical protein